MSRPTARPGRLRRLGAVAVLAALAWAPTACSSGGGDDLTASPVTTIGGPYTFDYLIPGNYYVTFFPVNDWLTTVPGTPSIITGTGPDMNDSQPAAGLQVGRSQTVTLAPGDNNPQLDAGFYAAEPIPTMGEAMRNLLAVLLLIVGFAAMRRKAAGLR